MKRSLWIALWLVAGCHHGNDENLGLRKGRRGVAVDVGALGASGELEKLLALPSAELIKRRGSHHFEATVHFAVESGETKDVLDETVRLDVARDGSSHLVHDNSHDYGIEAIAAKGSYYVRPRYGRFVQRSPEGDEVERARDEATGLMADYLAVLGRFVSRTVAGESVVDGKKLLKVQLGKAAAPEKFSDPDPAHAWRESIDVATLDGEVLVDAATGTPASETLNARYTAKRGDQTIVTTIAYHATLGDLDGKTPIAPPESGIVSLERTRPLLDKQTLLDGLTGRPAKKDD